MSRENLDTLRRNYERWAAGDWTDTSFYDPHLVYASQSSELDPGPHYGLEAAGAYMRRFLSSWDDMRIEAKAFREFGDTFVVHVHRTATGKESGISVDDEAFHVWSFRGDRVIRFDVFEHESAALAAVGAAPGENVALVKRIYEAWERGDFSSADWADPAIEYALVQGAEIDSVRGLEPMGRSWGDWLKAFDEFRARATEYIDRGADVLVLTEFEGRGKASGISVEEWPGASLFTIRDGKVVRLVLYNQRSDAIEALGLEA